MILDIGFEIQTPTFNFMDCSFSRGLDTTILIEIRFFQYLLIAKIGKTTGMMLNSVQLLLDFLQRTGV